MIEKGQIWRGKFGSFETIDTSGSFVTLVDQKGATHQVPHNVLEESFELVTLDNIKDGEWVFRYKDQKLYEITEVLDNRHVKLKGERGVYSFDFVTPCLPPTQEKPPIGIMPYDMFMEKHQEELSSLAKKSQEKRKNELVSAIERYLSKGLAIPIEWVEEYNKWVG